MTRTRLTAILRFLNLVHSPLPAGLEKETIMARGIITKTPHGMTHRSNTPVESEIIVVLSKLSVRHIRIANKTATRTNDARIPPNTIWPERLEG